MGWREKAKRAKRLHRPSLKDWECDGYYRSFRDLRRSIEARNGTYESFVPFATAAGHSTSGASLPGGPAIPAIIDAGQVSPKEFHRSVEGPGIPAVIKGIPEREGWPACRRWADLDALEADPDLRDRMFKVGEDDDGKSVKLKLKHFLRYLRANRDDSPLYVFDSAFDEDRGARRLLEDYSVPKYFDEDLFDLVGENRRPPYRWFLVGPERSGTTIHIDPLGTAAWNTLIAGRKRWVLFPPHVPKHIAKGKGCIRRGEDDEAVHYFDRILPRIKRRAAENDGTGDYENFACYEFTQNPGDTVYVPFGWWHAVLNMQDSTAITQNFCSQRNFDIVWIKTRTGRKKMAYKWLCQLAVHYPHLAERARELNRRDSFVMKYEPKEVKRREREQHQQKKARREAKAAGKQRERKSSRDKKSSTSRRRRNERIESTANAVLRSEIATSTTAGSDRDCKRSRLGSRAISPDTVMEE